MRNIMLKSYYKNITSTLIIIGIFILFSSVAYASENSMVVLQYKNLGDYPLYKDAISIKQFNIHIRELKKNEHTILPLSKALDTMTSEEGLTAKTISIVLNNIDLSIVENILPTIEKYNIPVTIILSTENLNNTEIDILEKLEDDSLIELGITPSNDQSLISETPENFASKVNTTITKYREIFETNPKIFSYPKGEYNNQIKIQISDYKFSAVLTETSGVIHSESDFLALPTILIDNKYAPTEQFVMVANLLPIYVSDVIPQDNIIDNKPPIIGFTINNDVENIDQVSCFASNIGKLDIKVITGNRIEIRPKKSFIYRNTHVKCTLPDGINWRQFSINLTNPSIEDENIQPLFKQGN